MASYEGSAGGAGGKFRKRPFRRSQTTPYDRPPTALRPSQAVAERNGWFSKVLDPASKLITAGAHKLFSSVFRRRLLPPPPPPPQHPPDENENENENENSEVRDMQPEATPTVVASSTKEPAIGGGNDASRISDADGVSELEDILKQKTFTRSEIDHLTALLLSRTVDNSIVAGKGRSEPESRDQCAIHGRPENETDLAIHENEIERGAPGAFTTPTLRSKVVEEDVASPAELAKAYMGSRPTTVSPSLLSLRNQMPREDLSAPHNPPFKLRSPGTSLLQKPVSDIGAYENGFVTPRFRGRSAIYSMARTPYSRIHPAASLKTAENTFDARAGPSSSHNDTDNLFNGSRKQVLKRRNSVLENDIGSVGPIRRIRQKPNLMHPKTLSLPASGGPRVTHGPEAHLDAPELPTSFSRSSHSHLLSKATADNSIPSTSSGYVPSQSIEMAEKIFQQLDKITPKGKSSESKIEIGGNSPTKMTPEMLGGLARRSMETVDSMKVLQSIRDNKRENGSVDSADTYFPPPKISSKVGETSMKKFDVSSDNMAPKNGAEAIVRTSLSLHNDNNKDKDTVKSQSISDQPPKKRAFQMSAHEDYLELDDDLHVNGVVSTPSREGTQGTDLPKLSADTSDTPPQSEAIGVVKPSVPDQKPSEASLLTKKESEPLTNVSVPAGNAAAFTFPVVPSSTAATSLGLQAAVPAPPRTLQCDKGVPPNGSDNGFPVFGNKSDKFPALQFSGTHAVESAIQKETKLEFASSANDAAAAKSNGPAENDKTNTQELMDVFKKPEDAPSPVNSSAKGIFNFGLPANNVTPNIGSLSTVSTTTAASSPVLFSSNQSSIPVTSSVSPIPPSDNSSLSNGFASSTSASTSANAPTIGSSGTGSSMTPFSPSSSQLSSSMTAPSVSTVPTFLFGSSAPPTSKTLDASASKSTENSGAKLTETAFGSTAGSLFGTKSPATASGGNDASGFSASTLKSATEAPKASPAASNGSIFSFQASSSSTPVSTSTQSFPSLFPSQASSPIFGLGTATNFSSGTSVFAANTFSSGTASVSSSLGASSSSSYSSSSGSASSIFGSSWQPSKPANMSSTFGSTPPSTGFSFGAAVSGSSADNKETPVLFGSSSPSPSAAANSAGFVFGAASSSAAPVFSFNSTPSTGPPSSQPAFGNTSTPAFAFGSTPSGNNDQMSMEDSMAEDSVQASTPAAPVFGQSPTPAPSPGFMFGATPSAGFGGAAAPPIANPFQFGSQPTQVAPQSPSPFQPSSSVEFNASGAGSFSLGTGGGDKSNRKIVKVKGRLRRK